jgi:ubiquinone/menaquinone biosynthesis C-methylase UbiE
MFDAGYENLSAFDYAPEGVECARKMFGDDRLKKIDLRVADARDLVEYSDNSFDAVLEKGTLDSVYLSGGKDKEKARLHLSMAVSEMARVLKSGGVVFSITAACADAVSAAFEVDEGTTWRQLRDGELHITEDGYVSTNIDATMFAWQRI